jgi:nucleotide-binding universal stress UspA family protein
MSEHVFPPRRILVPTDLGPASAVAMGFARIIHEKFSAPVEILHACHLDMPPYFSSGQIEALKREIRKARQTAEDLIRKENVARLGFAAGIVIVDKSALDAILEESERFGADLVIMGTHGRQGAKRLMLGSVAERVLRESRIPLLAVRESVSPGPFRHVFCPFNFSDVGRAALDYAADVAAASDAVLTIMHAQESGDGPPTCALVEEPIRKKCRVEEVLIGGEAAKSILEAVHRVKPDLIVMGAQKKPTVIGELFSSTTERVMQLAEAPLLVVPKK